MSTAPQTDIRYVVGVDLGGTNLRAAVIDANARKLSDVRGPSDAKRGQAIVRERVASAVQSAIQEAGVAAREVGAVGMAVPGHIEPRTGVILWSPNFGEIVNGQLQIFLDVPFCAPLSQALGIPCYAGNDANIAALGEFRYGAGRNVDDMVMFTLGTGIGGGVISNGRLVTGSTGGAVEIGHQVIAVGGPQCGCGTFGCMEAHCGTAAILERAHRLLEASNKPSMLFDRIQGDKTTLTPKMIDQAAEAGDEVALQVWEETGYYLGIGIANAVNLFNPAIVAIGGGIRKATGLLAAAERSMRRHTIYSLAHTCQIVEAELGEDAGLLGAAALAWQHVGVDR